MAELTPERVFARRLYQTSEWRRIRRKKITHQSLCEICLETETVEPATVVHHRVRHNGNRMVFFDYDQLISLCRQHHEEARLAKSL
ncbi:MULTISPECIES: HNH endonuclease signature motif containing protein [Rhizobium]|uniref:HNH endonuclease signature motif containing protein n=1 Tax=Rhizobium TaxID=379 RepID=UPI00195BFB11|nr:MULTISPECIES: HNH endonuclease signature motif containing protein [Rhizobium]MBM7050037.1 HNH endonuclease [Rhizobium lusitanum]